MEPVKSPSIEEAPQPAREATDVSQRVEYKNARLDIKTGDVFLYQGRTFWKPGVGQIAWITRLFTRSRYTHAGLAVWWDDRLMVIESIGRGVTLNPCSMSFARHKSDVEWFRYDGDISDETREALIAHAKDHLGKRFAFWKAFVALVKKALRFPPKFFDKYEREDRFYCSHFVASLYNSVGKDLKANHADPDMTPRDLAESPKLKRQKCIYRSPESGRPYDATRTRHSEIRKK